MRGYTKWDDQPASPVAAREAVLRANWIANTAPRGPTYVNLDAEMQESKLTEAVPPIEAARFMWWTVRGAKPPLPSRRPLVTALAYACDISIGFNLVSITSPSSGAIFFSAKCS